MNRILLLILVASTHFLLSQEQSSTYKIRPNDWLKVTVWKEPDLSGTLFVQPKGTIALPVVGEIHAAGLTLDELQDQIRTRLARYGADPRVKVTLGKAPSLKFEYETLPETWPEAGNCNMATVIRHVSANQFALTIQARNSTKEKASAPML